MTDGKAVNDSSYATELYNTINRLTHQMEGMRCCGNCAYMLRDDKVCSANKRGMEKEDYYKVCKKWRSDGFTSEMRDFDYKAEPFKECTD